MNQRVQKNQSDNPQLLLQRWHELRKKQPRLRIRNAAKLLKISEAELLATGSGQTVIRLNPDWEQLLQNLESLGTVMALTRNDYVVHEKTGVYSHVTINGNKGLVINDAIDLRLNLLHWHFAFAVEEETLAGLRRSLQFFDATGMAVHKIYLTDNSKVTPYNTLKNKFSSDNQSQTVDVTSSLKIKNESVVEINSEVLRDHWRSLNQIHDFKKMLGHFQLSRFEAITVAGSEFVTRIIPNMFRCFMEKIIEIKVPVMLFVSNKGVVQIHSGYIHNLKITGTWLNILDENFNFHLDEAAINSLYVVERPLSTGKLTSLELYDEQGNNIALIFGEYNSESGENPVWGDLLMSLPEDRGST